MTSEQIAELRQKHYNASVVGLTRSHSDLMVLRVRSDSGRPAHKPGQYCTLGLGNWEPRVPDCQDENLNEADRQKLVRRAYSISCSVLDERNEFLDLDNTDWLEFYIVLVRDTGKPKAPGLTPRLFMLNLADRLFVGDKITGHYTTDAVKEDDTVLFLSTGTGEAPNNYMLWELLKRGHRGRILAACCVRYRQDLAYLSIHEELMRRFPNYIYLSLTTREAETVTQKVYVQDLITSGQLEERLGRQLDPAKTQVFLCGNPKMIGVPVKDRATGQRAYPQPTGVIEILEKRGLTCDQPQAKIKGNIHFEEYW